MKIIHLLNKSNITVLGKALDMDYVNMTYTGGVSGYILQLLGGSHSSYLLFIRIILLAIHGVQHYEQQTQD